MINVTKNMQSEATLMKLIQHAFPEKRPDAVQELTEGYFNIAYEVSFDDGSKSILKIGPHPEVAVMAYEQNIMDTEVRSMKLVGEQTNIRVPEVEFYDDSCMRCSAPYFFMKKIEGQSLATQKPQLTAEQISHIQYAVGAMNKEINQLTADFFGYPGHNVLRGDNWHEVFSLILKAAIIDAENVNMALPIPADELWQLLNKDKNVFVEVATPRLVHWDIWDGNIFIHNGVVTGLIDWERCLWGDPLMEVGFRSYSQSPDFLRGYGIKELSESEQRRILWYDLYLLIIAAQEHVYRKYETADSYQWATALLREKYAELNKL